MKKKLPIIFISILVAFVLMSGGYGFWEKELTISGTITVEEPVEELSEAPEDEPQSINKASENSTPSLMRNLTNDVDTQGEEEEEDFPTEEVDTSPEKTDQGTEAKDANPQENPIAGDKMQPQSEGEEEVISE